MSRRQSCFIVMRTMLPRTASRYIALAVLVGSCALGAGGPNAPDSSGASNRDRKDGEIACEQATNVQRAIVPEVDTNQDQLNNRVLQNGAVIQQPSGYMFRDIVAKGRHLFTTPFIEADGAGEGIRFSNGEGPLGLREEAFNSNLRLLQGRLGVPDSQFGTLLDVVKPPFAKVDSKGNVRFSILRMNGLDSQSCFECHNSIGSQHIAGDGELELLDRKPGTTGGPAGQASNAFINEDFPNPAMMFVRNPPHVFGTGYVQKLAQTITMQLLLQKVALYVAAEQFPNMEVGRDLSFTDPKGRAILQFGRLSVTYVGDPTSKPDLSHLAEMLIGDAETDLSRYFVENRTELRGISRDLVVRPLQWKGIASDERNFVRSATMFHFGLLPRELNPDYLQPQENHDYDRDGVRDELSEGNVSALAIFTVSIRPPVETVPADKKEVVKRGQALFLGEPVDEGRPGAGREQSCAKCHVPSLPLYDTHVCIRDPRTNEAPSLLQHLTTLVAQHSSSRQLPVYRETMQRINAVDLKIGPVQIDPKQNSPQDMIDAVFRHLRGAIEPVGCPTGGYEFDLQMPLGSEYQSLSFSYPRLRRGMDQDGTTVVNVRLFSDLQRHDMGEGLTDKYEQATDVADVKVPRREYLTRPLWGVADSGPWLHDGRARTLEDAIFMHESLGSEANPVIEAFKKLSCDDQAAVVEFLLTMRLPVDCRYEPCANQPAECHPEPGGPGNGAK